MATDAKSGAVENVASEFCQHGVRWEKRCFTCDREPWRRVFIRRSHRIYILLPTVQVCPGSAYLMSPWEIEIRWLVWGIVIRGRLCA